MPLTVSRQRAEQLSAELERAIPRGVDVPAQADGVARELAVVAALRQAGQATAPVPSDEFRSALRTRLMAVAAVQGVGAPAPVAAPEPAAVSWRRRLATLAAGVSASAVAVTGVAAAAGQSLPGDPFYGLKRVVEDVQLRFADGPREEGERHLQFAEERLEELQQLALGRELTGGAALSADDADRVRVLLDDMDAETRSASRLLTEAFRASGDAAPVELLAGFAVPQADGLRDVLRALPEPLHDRVRESLALLGTLSASADELLLLRDCSTACDPAAAAPALTDPGAPTGAADDSPPCGCPTPPPAPAVAPPPPASTASQPAAPATSEPVPSATPTPSASPTPTPTPSALLPLPTLSPALPPPTLPELPDLEPGEPVQVPPLTEDLSGDVSGDGLVGDLGGTAPLVGGLVLPLGLLPLLRRRR